MPTKTEDNSLVAQYIRAIENPDSVGFQRGMVDNYWYQPSKRGYDPNNRGFGIDVVENKKTKKVVQGRTGKWLTEAEERALRNAHIDASKEVLKKWTPQILAASPSEAKQAMVIGMLYRGDGIKNILNNPALRDAFYSGSDADFQKAVSDFYQAKQFGERAQNHDRFMNTQPQPTAWPYDSFQPKTSFKEGGQLKPKQWQDLSMAEKATMMKAAVEEGIYDLPTIKAKYNEFAEGGHIYDGTSENSQQMKIGHPHYSYDEDGNIEKTSDGKPILNFNVTLPEVVITPDSTKSPGERAILERYRRQQYDHTHGAGIYNALLDRELTKLAIAKRQNEWNNSTQKKALDYAQAAAAIIGGGADTVSGYPVYGTLKGIRTAQEATTPEEYAEAGLWLAPAMIGGSKKVSAVLGKLNLPISRDMPLKGRTEIPRKIKAKAVNRYTSFINSPEYQNRLQRAGLEDHWDYMKELTDRRINNKGYFPERVQKTIKEDPSIEGLTNVNPSNPNYGITLRESLSAKETSSTLMHEIAHWATGNAGIDDAVNSKHIPFKHDPKVNFIGDIMRHNENTAPNIPWENILNKIPKTTPISKIEETYNDYRYFIDPSEKRARAVSLLQQAKDARMTTDAFVDKYVHNGRIAAEAPGELRDLGKIMTVNNIKKYLNNFLSGAIVVGSAAPIIKENN